VDGDENERTQSGGRRIHGASVLALGFLVALAAAAALSPGRSASGHTFVPALRSLAPPLDHFKCYVPKQHIVPNPPTGILLRDQFAGGKFRKVGVKSLFRFCNPVKKVFAGAVTPIRYPALHLSFYGITTPLPGNHTIVLSNQFGSQKIVIGPAKWIAVPTSKNSKALPSPKLLNHFECYPVLEGRAPQATVTLIDQWHAEKGVALGGPVTFCNPTEKVRAGKRSPLVNTSAHLTCYRLAAKPFAQKLQIRNQFNTTTLAVSGADMFCVPSLKLRHVP